MAELEKVLGAMNQINNRMRNVVRSPDDQRNRKIVELRQEFSAETGNLISLMPNEKRLISRPTLFHEFQDRLSLIQRKLASHQAKWSVQQINDNRGEYLIATDAVHSSISDYVIWAKNALTRH